MSESKKTKSTPALKNNLALCRKKLGVMNIELQIYREIGGMAVKGSSRAAMLNRVMEFTLKATSTDSGTLYLIDRDKKELVFEAVKGPGSKKLKGRRMSVDKGIAGLVASTGKPHISSDIKTDKLWADLKISKTNKNIMAAPLLHKKQVIGVIEVINKSGKQPFSKDDVKILNSISNHFSIIMERAELFAEQDERVKQFSILNEVGNLLISTLDQSVVRHRAMEAITKLMRAETGSLLLVDREKNQLYFEVALGEKGKTLKEIRLNIGEGIAGWVAKHGKPVIIHDVTKDKRFQANIDRKSKFTTRDMICVPVSIKGNIIGVLQAINRIGGGFKDEDLQLFQLFSNQVAIALDNARLYEEIRETFYATSGALAEAIEKRDPYTGGHTKRVLLYSLAIAKYMDLPHEALEVLKLSAVLHDIGKIGIKDSILQKNAPLDSDEAASMRTHPLLGAEILKHVPQLKEIVPGMLYHHERVDGLGYPQGFKNEEIPLTARIIAVADTYDAMTTTRPYRDGLPPAVALSELKKFAGKQFDEGVVNAFLKAFRNGDIDGKAQNAASPIKRPQSSKQL
ncbi:MAG: GAF domain-containing protein [Deltaproteobacteria bacterium]|nr:GAF domain-containing protein [Deltaproteobacteria bacterium]